MYVVIDSNIIISNYSLRYAAFTRFCKHFPEKKIDVFISKVSIEEIFKNHLQEIAKRERDYNDAIKNLNQVTILERGNLPSNYSATAHKEYKEYLRKVLRKNNFRTLNYPKISHEDIVKYSITGRKPFDSKDNGYKDFLIWNSIVELLQLSTRKVVFITNDHDFGENQLHADLTAHLKELKIDENRVELCKSINHFNDKHLRDIYDLVALKDWFKTQDVTQELEEKAKYKLESHVRHHHLSDKVLAGIYESPEITEITEYISFHILSVEPINRNQALIEFASIAHCRVQFYIYKSEFFTISDSDLPDIVDFDWNDHYILAENTYEFKIAGSFQTTNDLEISDISLDDIELL